METNKADEHKKSPKTDRRNGNGERNRNSRSIRYREWETINIYSRQNEFGLNIYSAQPKNFPELKAGMKVTVTGKVTTYKGLVEIVPDQDRLKIDAVNQPLPSPKKVSIKQLESDQASKYEGRLVKVKGYVEQAPDQPVAVDTMWSSSIKNIIAQFLESWLIRVPLIK